MRTFAVPAQYATLLEGEVARIVDEIRRDVFRREHNEAPLFPDVFLDDVKTDGKTVLAIDTLVVIGTPDEKLHVAIEQAVTTARAQQQRRRKTA